MLGREVNKCSILTKRGCHKRQDIVVEKEQPSHRSSVHFLLYMALDIGMARQRTLSFQISQKIQTYLKGTVSWALQFVIADLNGYLAVSQQVLCRMCLPNTPTHNSGYAEITKHQIKNKPKAQLVKKLENNLTIRGCFKTTTDVTMQGRLHGAFEILNCSLGKMAVQFEDNKTCCKWA